MKDLIYDGLEPIFSNDRFKNEGGNDIVDFPGHFLIIGANPKNIERFWRKGNLSSSIKSTR